MAEFSCFVRTSCWATVYQKYQAGIRPLEGANSGTYADILARNHSASTIQFGVAEPTIHFSSSGFLTYGSGSVHYNAQGELRNVCTQLLFLFRSVLGYWAAEPLK